MLLKTYLGVHNLKVPEIATLCAVSKQSVYNWCSGNKPIPDAHARLIQYYAASPAAMRIQCNTNIFDANVTAAPVPLKSVYATEFEEYQALNSALFSVKTQKEGMNTADVERWNTLSDIYGRI